MAALPAPVDSPTINREQQIERKIPQSRSNGFQGPRDLTTDIKQPAALTIDEPLSLRSESMVKGGSRQTEKSPVVERRFVAQRVNTDRVVRTHLGKQILADLVEIQPRAGTPSVTYFATKLIGDLRTFLSQCSKDPYCRIASAFHDALAYELRCLDYTAEQYEQAHQVLADSLSRNRLDYSNLTRAIFQLEAIGFDTLPFEFDTEREAHAQGES